MTKPITTKEDQPKGRGWIWLVVGICLFAYFYNHTGTSRAPPELVKAAEGMAATAVPNGPVAEPPINEETLALATEHTGKALGADGGAGATAYSINCWASLERSFDLATADRCAAFDSIVLARVIDDPLADVSWFAEEQVSLRYTQALVDQTSNVADVAARLERLRVAAAVRKVVLIVSKTRPKPEPTAGGEFVENDPVDEEISNMDISLE